MKKLIIPLVILLMAVSCKKENCHCGEVYNLVRSIQAIDVRNDCTENATRFIIKDRREMEAMYVQKQYCAPDGKKW